MTGGLIEIVTYGSQDLYLTGTPEITFFKVVYRRHTNFSMESVRVKFDDTVGFGLTSSITIPKVGDLAHKMYLEIILPRIDLKRDDFNNNLKEAFDEATTNYGILTEFMSVNRRAYVEAHEICIAENNNNIDDLKDKINIVFDDPNVQDVIDNFKDLLINTPNIPFLYDEISMKSIAENDTSNDITILCDALKVGINKSIKTQKFFFNDFKNKRTAHLDAINKNIKFAWVERIGHAIIDEIEVKIGGQKVDRHWGDWINIWYELTANRDMENIYFKMIGNVDELTTLNREVKPRYKLRIPLQFWFNRYSGLSLPLVALEYHDVTMHIKFRKLEDVAYIEDGKKVFVSETMDKLFLDEISSELNININATLLIDYIYLDAAERRKFAQSSHEYLIDQLQLLELSNVTQPVLHCVLNNFVHPSKEIIWVAQQRRFVQNFTGHHKNQWDNYSLTEENRINPIIFSTIDFHGYTRVPRLSGNYYNYVQPYQHHYTTPSDGINTYSFSLYPEEHQPSGSANFSRLSRVLLTLEFAKILFPEGEEGEILDIRVYTRSTNILRILSGMAGTAFTYG